MEKSLKCLAKSFDVPGAFSVLFLPVVQDALTHYVRGVLQIEQCLADARPSFVVSSPLHRTEIVDAGTSKMPSLRLVRLVNLCRRLPGICSHVPESGAFRGFECALHPQPCPRWSFQPCNDITDRLWERRGENNPLLGVSMSLFTPRPPTNWSLRSGTQRSRMEGSIKCHFRCQDEDVILQYIFLEQSCHTEFLVCCSSSSASKGWRKVLKSPLRNTVLPNGHSRLSDMHACERGASCNLGSGIGISQSIVHR